MKATKNLFAVILLLLIGNLNLFGQNLSFEEIEKGKPTGWHDFGRGDFTIGIDSIISQSGKKAGTIVSDNGAIGFRAWAFEIPAKYAGKKIKLTGYIKTEDVSEGYAGLWMRIDPEAGFNNMGDRGITGTTDWEKYVIEYEYNAPKAKQILVGGLLTGKGKMWLDNLEITIDGKKLQDVKPYQKPELSEKVQETIITQIDKNSQAFSLASDEILDKNLSKLIASIGDKKIVAIGEDTHGTSEYYKLREAITKKLILEKGFTTIILENPYDDIEVLTTEIQNKNLDSLMQRHLFSIYQTKEMKSFLDWYKNYSSTNPIQFKGCDDSYWVLHELILKEIATIDDRELKNICNRFTDKINLGMVAYLKKHPNESETLKTENDLSTAVYNDVLAIESYLISKKVYSERLKELLFNAKNTYINYKKMSEKQPIESRDKVMAQRIAFFAKNPNAKIIVWAHNAHISNTVIIDNEIGIMGRDLKTMFGKKYHSIGLSSLEGSHSYIENRFINDNHDYKDQLIKNILTLHPKSSWESVFSQAKNNAYYFNTKDIKTIPILESLKLVGYNKESAQDYYTLFPLAMFDTLFFIKTTTATNPLLD